MDERLQLGRESPGISDINNGGEATHILHRDARQTVGN
ncbi:hypothetical protein XAC3615_13180002 [Xanthomonas citri pv. citri]|nr:hypothetical protein XAC3615_13180002 [Xanthomonas citri pv. citri]